MAKKTRFDYVTERIKALTKNDSRFAALGRFLAELKRDPSSNPFGTYELLAETAERILSLKTTQDINKTIADAVNIFRTVAPLGENTPAYEHKTAVFLKIFDKGGIYDCGLFSVTFYNTFFDKNIYISVMDSLMLIQNTAENFKQIEAYAYNTRQYFADEQSFGISVVNAAAQMSSVHNLNKLTDTLVMDARRAAGIYDVSEEALEKVDSNVRKIEQMVNEIQKHHSAAMKLARSYKAFAESSENSLRDISAAEESNIRSAASAAALDMKRAYEDMLRSEQKKLDLDKDKLLREIVDSSDEKIRELRMISESIKESAAADLFRINTEANRAAEKAASILNNNELKNIITELGKNDGLIEKIVRVEQFSRNFDESAVEIVPAKKVQISEQPEIVSVKPPQAIFSEEPDMKVCPFFDEKIPFEKRMQVLIKKKNENAKKNGVLYHTQFDTVLTAVIEDANPYLIGPSGCGKTYLIGQIAELLGIECLDIGYINEEYDIIGFQTASGGYSYPPFYRAYKYGGIVFCDEFDNSNSRAAVKLNSFMSGGANQCYCFPNGELVKRHPNFRIIAAGNTSGSGADRNYNTREKIEESVQQRFTSMYLTYDDRLERKILENYPDWISFV
ncbi:MAG: AAA family ATPase, partial [Oscillospiraceae bacterium]|nr:AAA family ATPase [Oscillospiraceae bacterium]